MKKKFLISLLGLPGTGKGTQGRVLAKEKHLHFISVGDLIKKACAMDANDPFCQQVNEYFRKGEPQPKENVEKILMDKLDKLDLNVGVIIDQLPLHVDQVEIFEKIFKKYNFDDYAYCYLSAPKEKLMERLLSRKYCSSCQRTYGPGSQYYDTNTCQCGTTLGVRQDDKLEVIINRFKHYKIATQEVLDYFKDDNHLLIINADQDIDDVQSEFLNKLTEHFDDF